MQRGEFLDRLDAYQNAIRDLFEQANQEYANNEEVFTNFIKLSADLGISKEQVLWVYAMKHRDGIAAHLKGFTSQREDVRGRIKDLIVYLFLLWGMIDEADGGTGSTLPTRAELLSQTLMGSSSGLRPSIGDSLELPSKDSPRD